MWRRKVMGFLGTGQLLLPIFVLASVLTVPMAVAAPVQEGTLPPPPRTYTESDQRHMAQFILGAVVSKLPKPADCQVDACVALTFDDGPDPNLTPQVIDTLEKAHASATFFVLGNKVAGHEALLQRMQSSGFEVGNHTWDHKDLTRLSNAQISAEVDATSQAIAAAGLPYPTLFRPPYGAINYRVAGAVPLPLIMWNVDPQDWHNQEPDQDVQSIMQNVQPGSIVILHDTHSTTVEALPKLLETLQAHGYKVVTVSHLLSLNADSRGVYRNR